MASNREKIGTVGMVLAVLLFLMIAVWDDFLHVQTTEECLESGSNNLETCEMLEREGTNEKNVALAVVAGLGIIFIAIYLTDYN